MTALEKAARALAVADHESEDDFIGYIIGARAAIESLRTPGAENSDRIFNAMLDRILREEV